jgi:uncharacterized membrane protein
MRYFKYRNINQIRIIADKEYLASLGKDKEKKILKSRKKKKILSFFGVISFIILYATILILISLIPKPDSMFLAVIYSIGCVLLGIIGLIASVIAVVIPIGKLIDKEDYNLPVMHRKFMAKACEDIRKYYGFNDEYLITKCFYSSNSIFINHDICVFRYDDEIRITTDIVNGFIYSDCDLGCYSIKINELKIYKGDYNNKRVTTLEFGKEKFIIGIKAYSYMLKLMSFKIYKFSNKSLSFNNERIHIRNRKNINVIKFTNIEKIELSIPKYTSIPGSGYDYTYTINIFDLNSNRYGISLVLEKHDEKELIEFIQEKNLNLIVNYHDNKYEGID